MLLAVLIIGKQMKRDLISVVIPVYGDKKLVKILYEKLVSVFSRMPVDYEIIEVCDACPYGSADEIRKLAKKDKKVKFINLSRNFGQHLAIKAGLDYASGDYTVVMDCDLQDNPEDIVRLYKKIKTTKVDVVFGEREKREDSFFKKICSKAAQYLIYGLSDFSHCDARDLSNLSIFSKNVLNVLKEDTEPYFVFTYIILSSGFEADYITISQEQRMLGKSGYNFFKGARLFCEALTSNSNKPLIFAGMCSFLMFVFCGLFILKLLFDYFVFGQRLLGWTSIMISIFFIAALLFAYLGILGVYIGQIFKMSQGRKIYMIKEKANL